MGVSANVSVSAHTGVCTWTHLQGFAEGSVLRSEETLCRSCDPLQHVLTHLKTKSSPAESGCLGDGEAVGHLRKQGDRPVPAPFGSPLNLSPDLAGLMPLLLTRSDVILVIALPVEGRTPPNTQHLESH